MLGHFCHHIFYHRPSISIKDQKIRIAYLEIVVYVFVFRVF